MKKLILTSEGIKVIDAPEKWDAYEEHNYYGKVKLKQALEKGIKEGVLFKPDDEAINDSLYHGTLYDMKQGVLYPIPEGYDVEIEKTCIYDGNKDACGNETCWDLQECQKSPLKQYAILVKAKEPNYTHNVEYGTSKKQTPLQKLIDKLKHSIKLYEESGSPDKFARRIDDLKDIIKEVEKLLPEEKQEHGASDDYPVVKQEPDYPHNVEYGTPKQTYTPIESDKEKIIGFEEQDKMNAALLALSKTSLFKQSIEEAAVEYAVELYPINGESREVVDWIEKQKLLIETGFIAGVKWQEDLAISFANWLRGNPYFEGRGIKEDGKLVTTIELFEVFKQQKK